MKKLSLLMLLLCFIMISATDNKEESGYKPKMENEIEYHGFSVDWSISDRIPRMVYYSVEYDSLTTLGRTYFGADPFVDNCTYPEEYNDTGYDRGHLLPSASACNYLMWEDCYYMTNIAPQDPTLNRGLWKSIENFERNNSYPRIYVVTGTICTSSNFIASTGIRIPDKFYKAIYHEDSHQMIGFICDQSYGRDGWYINDCIVTIDSIEKVIGKDLFYQIPEPLQGSLERKVDKYYWDW